MSLKSNLKEIAKSDPRINPSIFLFLKIINDYSKKYNLPQFSLQEFKDMHNKFSTLIKNKNPTGIIREIVSIKQKGGEFISSSSTNEEIVEIQYESLKKIFAYTVVLISLNLFSDNEIERSLLPIYTFICMLFLLQVAFNIGFFIEGVIILFGRLFGIFRNVVNEETIVQAFAEPTILAELYHGEDRNLFLNQLKENTLSLIFQRPGLAVARVHFPWEEFIIAENLDDLFNVEDTEEDDLPYLLGPRGGARKNSRTTKMQKKIQNKKRMHKKTHKRINKRKS